MAITFKSVGHFFAVAYTAVVKGLEKVEGTETTVETATSSIPGSATAVLVEKGAYAVLGEISSLLAAGGAAAASKLADAGLDKAVVTQVQTLMTQVPELVVVAKTL